ncbi:unnamed protein product [Hymenolepis diminuta]|uniref:Rho-GAP domain-containing protein n=1 Tax=Hymenolepis diminuta TaxID=6216 RepID=A0A0R3SCQ0_HYMDI|nr:unnamed protein product [Hymenolepis diminuta]
MPLLPRIKSCVRRKDKLARRPTKVYFNVKFTDAFKSENLASQLKSLLVYIAREGVTVTDLFRRPGNIQSIKRIISDLEAGVPVNWMDYNFYTLANLAKRFLLNIDGGLLGKESEMALLDALDIIDLDARSARMKSIITSQPKTVQQLLTLLFGTWFRMIYHTEVNAMSVEAVAKSVAGSIFPNMTISAESVEKASKVMEILIVGFASTEVFGQDLIDYFTQETGTSISRIEKFKYEFRYPKNVPRQYSLHMFRQMLINESRKHGFDILQDEVTKEQFEQVNQTMTLDLPEYLFPPLQQGGETPTGDKDGVSRNASLRLPLSSLQASCTSSPATIAFPSTPIRSGAVVDENDARKCELFVSV